jgi:hypothetical protein
MRVERTHRADLRWHDLGKLVSGDGDWLGSAETRDSSPHPLPHFRPDS